MSGRMNWNRVERENHERRVAGAERVAKRLHDDRGIAMRLKYDGQCAECRQGIPKGEQALWSKANGVRHLALSGCRREGTART